MAGMNAGRYRLRTWLRGRLPVALADVVRKGARDCGAHEWYRADEQTWRCYHCEPPPREILAVDPRLPRTESPRPVTLLRVGGALIRETKTRRIERTSAGKAANRSHTTRRAPQQYFRIGNVFLLSCVSSPGAEELPVPAP